MTVPSSAATLREAASSPRVALFATTLALGSFLMFALEPMIARMLLPHLGGAPMVWNTCVVFFQMTLLAGYAWAHGARRWLDARMQTLLHTGLVALAILALPILVGPRAADGEGAPAVRLIVSLAASIGLPFFALAASTTTLQAWFSSSDDPRADDPYFLFVASNLGSLAALVAYPAIIEPILPVSVQRSLWTAGYVAFTLAVLGCGVHTWRHVRRVPSSSPAVPGGESISWRQRLTWLGLSLIPSSLLLGVTGYLSTDIAAVPLLWVIPLSVYLLTFAIAFAPRRSLTSTWAAERLPLFAVAVVVFMTPAARASIWLLVPLHLGVFGLASLMCHSGLAERRPAPSHLTEFYLWISFGGMLGGLFNTFAAPVIFHDLTEFPLMLVLACAAGVFAKAPAARPQHQRPVMMDALFPAAVGTVALSALYAANMLGGGRAIVFGLIVPAVMSFSQSRRPLRLAASLGAMLMAASIIENPYGHVLLEQRTFFGVYRVVQDHSARSKLLLHGTTLHGGQWADRPEVAISYYHSSGPFGQMLEGISELARTPEVAVVGLGAGALSVYARPGQRWTFYEIDRAVEQIARHRGYFTYLEACGARCRVLIGDARLRLADAPPSTYGVIALDAFSSDAIPVHLLTREAVLLYASRLRPQGVLAFNISNRFLTLRPILARLAAEHRLTALAQLYEVPPESVEAAEGAGSSEWVVMARDPHILQPLIEDSRWTRLIATLDTPLWTDDFSNVVRVLKFR